MTWLIVGIFVAVAIATYLSTLNFALIGLSRAALQRALDDRNRSDAADWLHDEIDHAILATALFRTLARTAIYVAVIAAVVGLPTQTTITWPQLIVGGLIAALFIWFSTIVMSSAVARHGGVRIIASSLPLLRVVTLICRPLTATGAVIDRIAKRLLASSDPDAAEEEFLQTIEDSQREGALDIQSAEILENVVEFTNTEVAQVMTPRSEIEGIEYTDDLSAVREFILHAGHSRIPVYRSTVDNIVGILYLKDLIKYLGEEPEDFKLARYIRQPIVVPETKPVRELLSVFQHGEVHMAIVIDEFGGTAGLVTIEDVLEEIVGDIRDEHEPVEHDKPEYKVITDTHIEADGRVRIDEVNDRMQLEIPESGEYTTIAGFVLAHFGRVPVQGESFESCNARFTTLAATPKRVHRVAIELLQPTTSNGQSDLRENAAQQ